MATAVILRQSFALQLRPALNLSSSSASALACLVLCVHDHWSELAGPHRLGGFQVSLEALEIEARTDAQSYKWGSAHECWDTGTWFGGATVMSQVVPLPTKTKRKAKTKQRPLDPVPDCNCKRVFSYTSRYTGSGDSGTVELRQCKGETGRLGAMKAFCGGLERERGTV